MRVRQRLFHRRQQDFAAGLVVTEDGSSGVTVSPRDPDRGIP
jgi:hypothetical protein